VRGLENEDSDGAWCGRAGGRHVPCRNGAADDAVLTIDLGSGRQRYTAAALLARPDVTSITVPNDVSYGHAMSYSAVPLLSLLDLQPNEAPFDTLQASATDGFVSRIPLGLMRGGAEGGSRAWIAVQDPARPWPDLPGRDFSAGRPFYLIWEDPDRSGIGSEQWPTMLAALSGVMAPAKRWPQMAVGKDLPAHAPERRGQEVFTTQCPPCHRIKGAGEMGPDLGTLRATPFSTPKALRQLIRNPKSLFGREHKMPGFDRKMISDSDLDAAITYLMYMVDNKSKSAQ
jgi:mono/diheme cytochrome c family protein